MERFVSGLLEALQTHPKLVGYVLRSKKSQNTVCKWFQIFCYHLGRIQMVVRSHNNPIERWGISRCYKTYRLVSKTIGILCQKVPHRQWQGIWPSGWWSRCTRSRCNPNSTLNTAVKWIGRTDEWSYTFISRDMYPWIRFTGKILQICCRARSEWNKCNPTANSWKSSVQSSFWSNLKRNYSFKTIRMLGEY